MINRDSGFTLIEVVITIVIVGIIASMASLMLATALTKRVSGHNIATSITKGRIAFERLSKSLRHADSFSTIQNQTVTFTTQDNKTVSYQLSGSDLVRSENNGPDRTLISGVSSLQFQYYDNNLNQTSTASQVRCIRVKMTTTVENVTHDWRSAICPRSLG